ncbi:MAG: hypothetical protein H7062_20205, partial [Candidatus Saccharimonas sp.]|nr:hypothetical protein [Planctomycetaceae bacterium]
MSARSFYSRQWEAIDMDDPSITNDEPPAEPTAEPSADSTPPAVDPIPDTRLYVPDHEDWQVHIKRDSERHFCYAKHPGEDWFHLLLSGEIYVARQDEKYCLRCALRMGFLTEDRLYCQHRVPKKR